MNTNLTDLEIAASAKILNITDIAKKIDISSDEIEQYGKDKAKLSLDLLKRIDSAEDGKLILVTAITPTPLGEGKSTSTIGIVDALSKMGKRVIGALREPSLGPVFGIKGGAAGGGYAQVNPMADINLHFTGDLHAITSANNLISACIDNHIFQGNKLQLDPNRIVWQRCVDLNDRALREVLVGINTKKGVPGRKESFNITVASEIMAVLCLAKDMKDLKERLDDLIIGYNMEDEIVTVKDLGITGAVAVLLKDAIKPNLVQTLENNPILMHGGPFANIAHGCNSIIATKAALKLADYVVTEAGFGADLGAEKFLDIKCREASLTPNAVVLVTTLKALKYHGGEAKDICSHPNLEALKKGICNLEKHIDTLERFQLPYIIALNLFESDTKEELTYIENWAKEHNYPFAVSNVYQKGGEGGLDLSKKLLKLIDDHEKSEFKYIYDLDDAIETKIEKIAKNVYGAKDVVYENAAIEALKTIKNTKLKDKINKYYICMAKTPLSLSDNPKLVGRPIDFTLHIKEIRVSAGARFLVCLTGDVMTMPGLPKTPLAEKIYIDDNNVIHNLS